MTWPICRGPGCSPRSAAVSSTAAAGDRGQLVVGQLGGQVAGQHLALGPLLGGQLVAPGGGERLGRLGPLLGLLGDDLEHLGVVQLAGLGAGDLGVADRGQGHPQGGLHQLVARLHGRGEVAAQLVLQCAHGRAR